MKYFIKIFSIVAEVLRSNVFRCWTLFFPVCLCGIGISIGPGQLPFMPWNCLLWPRTSRFSSAEFVGNKCEHLVEKISLEISFSPFLYYLLTHRSFTAVGSAYGRSKGRGDNWGILISLLQMPTESRVVQAAYTFPGFVLRLYNPITMEPVGSFDQPFPPYISNPVACIDGR